jgi:hypothetical protein
MRDAKCNKLIEFVKRRDLDKIYVNTYENKKEEVWHFINSAAERESDNEDQSGVAFEMSFVDKDSSCEDEIDLCQSEEDKT